MEEYGESGIGEGEIIAMVEQSRSETDRSLEWLDAPTVNI